MAAPDFGSRLFLDRLEPHKPINDIMNLIVRLIDTSSEFTGKLCAWALFAVGLCITYEISVRSDIARALLGTAPTIWVDEVSRIIQVWVAYLAPAYVMKNRGMITIEVALKDPESMARRVAETLGIFMLFIFAGVAAYFGFELWLKATLAGHTTDSFLAPPKWLTHSAVWVGFSLFIAQGFAELYRIWTIGIQEPNNDPLTGSH